MAVKKLSYTKGEKIFEAIGAAISAGYLITALSADENNKLCLKK